jgi:sporulation protein YlmC with PRC-barrel domain
MNKFNHDNQSGKNHEGSQPNRPVKFLTATSIIGDHVHNTASEHLGSIKDIMVNVIDGKIEYVVLEQGGILGIGEKLYAIPFALLKLNTRDELFILDVSKEELTKSPGFDKLHWPETNAHAFEDYNAYWGNFMGSNVGSF